MLFGAPDGATGSLFSSDFQMALAQKPDVRVERR
jgi:hypothetical protein